MKIIFENEEERDNFMINNPCPNSIGLEDTCEVEKCAECWKSAILKAGIVDMITQ